MAKRTRFRLPPLERQAIPVYVEPEYKPIALPPPRPFMARHTATILVLCGFMIVTFLLLYPQVILITSILKPDMADMTLSKTCPGGCPSPTKCNSNTGLCEGSALVDLDNPMDWKYGKPDESEGR